MAGNGTGMNRGAASPAWSAGSTPGPPCPYERLPGSGRARRFISFSVAGAGKVTLWLGPDHLLQIERTCHSERYKRFRFRDIQAIIIRPRPAADEWRNIITAILVVVLLAGGATVGGYSWYFFGPVAAALLIWLIFNLACGPSCCSHLITAVQTEQLVSLHRLRNAHRVLARLRPLILAAQADGPTADAADDADTDADADATPPPPDSLGRAASARPPPMSSRASAVSPTMRPPVFNRLCHYGLCAALLGLSVTAGLCFLVVHPATLLLMLVASMVVGAMAIAALVLGHRAQVGGGVAMATWAGGTLPLALFFAYFVFSMYLAATQLQDTNNQWRLLLLVAEEIAAGGWAQVSLSVVAGVAAVLAAWVYLALRQGHHEPQPLPGMTSAGTPPPLPVPAREEAGPS